MVSKYKPYYLEIEAKLDEPGANEFFEHEAGFSGFVDRFWIDDEDVHVTFEEGYVACKCGHCLPDDRSVIVPAEFILRADWKAENFFRKLAED